MSQKIKENEFTYDEMQKALALHIWKNDHLRDEIVKNPKKTIEAELNVKFNDEVKINIVNHTDPNQISFVLPYDIHKLVGQSLSDDQLEEIAGGNIGGDIKHFFHGAQLEQIGKKIGDLIGSGVQLAGSTFGVSLPNTGLGKKVGGVVGKGIENILGG